MYAFPFWSLWVRLQKKPGLFWYKFEGYTGESWLFDIRGSLLKQFPNLGVTTVGLVERAHTMISFGAVLMHSNSHSYVPCICVSIPFSFHVLI